MLKLLQLQVFFTTFAVLGAKHKPRELDQNCTSAPHNDVSCHDTYIDNDLPTADQMEFPEKSIFFVESSCKGSLDSRQACAVESAARAHPLWQINVLFAGPVPSKCHKNRALSTLKRYKNVKFYRIHPLELAQDTPLEFFLNMDPLEFSYWPVIHASDILRYLTLYKWSGVYLDLDIIVLRPFDGLARNWAAKEMSLESELGVASGALALSGDNLGREVAAAAIDEIRFDFRGWKWNYNGPGVILRTLKRLCSTSNAERMSDENCQGFAVYDTYLFYPIHYADANRLFEEGQLDLGPAYTCHFWTSSSTYDLRVRQGSPYAALAAHHCPRVFSSYGRLFGYLGA